MSEPQNQPKSLAERLRGSTVSVRGEIDVSRHVFRDGVSYVVRDPVSFATNRLSPDEYAVLCAIDDDATLGEVFERLIADATLDRDDEELFYSFVLDLHQKCLLTLPINDGEALFRRHEKRRRATRLAKVMGILFLRVPLAAPDAFLSRTAPAFRWLFTTPALAAYLLLIAAAGAIAVSRFDELTSPFLTMVTGSNAVLLWTTLIGLKVVHEFGHAYACKVFGGHVPEMGAYLILLTPCAYVDATDSWSFPSTRRRAVVTLAGLYFETTVGAVAMFVWAFTEPSTLNTVAYQVVLLATVVTIGFNLNPLMRYDAYYLVSDLVGIPNLRARSKGVLARLGKRSLFGVQPAEPAEPAARAVGLGCFGAAQMIYRAVLMVTIAAVLVLKLGLIGAWLAGGVLLMTAWGAVAGVGRYILFADEMRGRRARGALVSAGLAAAAIGIVASVPLPNSINATGVASRDSVVGVRSPAAGFVREVRVSDGSQAPRGSVLLEIEEPSIAAGVARADAQLRAAMRRSVAAAAEGPAAQAAAAADVRRAAAALDRARRDESVGSVRSPIAGTVIAMPDLQPGAFLEQGAPVATIGAGDRVAIFLIRESEIESLRLEVGDPLTLRAENEPATRIHAEVARIDEAGERTLRHEALGAAAGGPVAVDPVSGLAAQPVFEVRARIPEGVELPDGAMVHARFPASPVTLATAAHRSVALFFNKTRASAGTP